MTLDIDSTIRVFHRLVAKLPATADRPIARRNARKRVLASLWKLRALVDEAYPAIVNRSEPRTRRSPQERAKALERAGWVRTSAAGHYAAAGVPIKRVAWTEVHESQSPPSYVARKGWVRGTTRSVVKHEALFIPKWASVIGHDKPTELRAAKKSMKLRKAALVVEALR